MSDSRFPRNCRLKGEASFRRIFREGFRVEAQGQAGWLTLWAAPKEGPTRFGCSVRKRAVPLSSRRNLLKRWLRETFRRHRRHLPAGFDLVALVREAPALSYAETEKVLLRLLDRLSSSSGFTGR